MGLPLNLPGPFQARKPAHTVLGKLLQRGSQLGLVQGEIVHGADAQDAHAGESGADAIHERAARGTEVVGHGMVRVDGVRGNGARLAKGRQVLAAAQVLQVGVGDDEVGRECGRGDFVAVGAVADEGAGVAAAVGWLQGLGMEFERSRADGRAEVDFRMPVVRRHRSMLPSLHLRWTSRRWPSQPRGSRAWICRWRWWWRW